MGKVNPQPVVIVNHGNGNGYNNGSMYQQPQMDQQQVTYSHKQAPPSQGQQHVQETEAQASGGYNIGNMYQQPQQAHAQPHAQGYNNGNMYADEGNQNQSTQQQPMESNNGSYY